MAYKRYIVYSAKALSGDKNKNAKLTETQVLTIRDRWASGDKTNDHKQRLADDFNCCVGNISRIVYRLSWRDI